MRSLFTVRTRLNMPSQRQDGSYSLPFVLDNNRLLVALTRAQRTLIVVSNTNLIQQMEVVQEKVNPNEKCLLTDLSAQATWHTVPRDQQLLDKWVTKTSGHPYPQDASKSSSFFVNRLSWPA